MATLTQMRDLFDFAQQNNVHSAPTALHSYLDNSMNSTLQQQQQQQQQQHNIPNMHMNMPPNSNPFQQPGPPGMRTPSMNGPPNAMNHFPSPAHQHLNLPNAMNSPHMRPGGSPAHPPTMGAPSMAAQLSHQGSNSSANASPGMANRKRRASIVKMEGPTDAGAQVNGVGDAASKVKGTPRMGGKKQKGNAS